MASPRPSRYHAGHVNGAFLESITLVVHPGGPVRTRILAAALLGILIAGMAATTLLATGAGR